MNVVVLRGRLARPVEERMLLSGERLVAYEIAVPLAGGPASTVPVVWQAAPAAAVRFAPGAEVVVAGRVRRRFFRVHGATQSRTEVVADAVVGARTARARALVTEAVARLGSSGAPAGPVACTERGDGRAKRGGRGG